MITQFVRIISMYYEREATELTTACAMCSQVHQKSSQKKKMFSGKLSYAIADLACYPNAQ